MDDHWATDSAEEPRKPIRDRIWRYVHVLCFLWILFMGYAGATEVFGIHGELKRALLAPWDMMGQWAYLLELTMHVLVPVFACFAYWRNKKWALVVLACGVHIATQNAFWHEVLSPTDLKLSDLLDSWYFVPLFLFSYTLLRGKWLVFRYLSVTIGVGLLTLGFLWTTTAPIRDYHSTYREIVAARSAGDPKSIIRLATSFLNENESSNLIRTHRAAAYLQIDMTKEAAFDLEHVYGTNGVRNFRDPAVLYFKAIIACRNPRLEDALKLTNQALEDTRGHSLSFIPEWYLPRLHLLRAEIRMAMKQQLEKAAEDLEEADRRLAANDPLRTVLRKRFKQLAALRQE